MAEPTTTFVRQLGKKRIGPSNYAITKLFGATNLLKKKVMNINNNF
jgi:hypothetical protein